MTLSFPLAYLMDLIMRAFLYLLTVLILFASQSSFADKIYRWTDDNGQIHFSSHPPTQTEQAEEVLLRAYKPSTNSKTNTHSDTSADSNNNTVAANNIKEQPKEQPVAAKPVIDPEVAARNCRMAKEQKQVLSENFNRRFNQPDGSSRPLTDEERSSKLKQMDDLIKQYCH